MYTPVNVLIKKNEWTFSQTKSICNLGSDSLLMNYWNKNQVVRVEGLTSEIKLWTLIDGILKVNPNIKIHLNNKKVIERTFDIVEIGTPMLPF